MNNSEQQPEPSNADTGPTIIDYPSTTLPGRRRWWAYVVLTVYLLLAGALLSIPIWVATSSDLQSAARFAAVVTALTICGLALLLTPVRVTRRRPITRRSILIPIIASGFLLGGLVIGGGFALAELWAPASRLPYYNGANTTGPPTGYIPDHSPKDITMWMIVAAAVAVWIVWSIVLGLMVRQRDPKSFGMKLHRLLLAGSVLELLVAVPSHIIVRRRTDCCAGIVTGMGICIGVAIAFVSFGPTVLLLYQKRCKQIRINPEGKLK